MRIRQIADGDAEADLCGKMQHGLDAAQRPIDRSGVTHVRRLEFDAGRRRPGPPGVNVRAQRVHHAHLIGRAPSSSRKTCPADESGAAGEQDFHVAEDQ